MTIHFFIKQKANKIYLQILEEYIGQSPESKIFTILNPILCQQANQRTLPFAQILI